MPPTSNNHRPSEKVSVSDTPLDPEHCRVEPSQTQSGHDKEQAGQGGQLAAAATASPVLKPLATSWAQMPTTFARGITSKRLEIFEHKCNTCDIQAARTAHEQRGRNVHRTSNPLKARRPGPGKHWGLGTQCVFCVKPQRRNSSKERLVRRHPAKQRADQPQPAHP